MRDRHDHLAHRRAEPRQFTVLWTVYLLIASAVAIGQSGFLGMIQPEVYQPAARTLMAVAGAGICLLWPMVRLSQAAPTDPRSAFALDAAVVFIPTQAILWSQCLPWMAGWPGSVAGTISLEFAAWSILVGGFLAWYFTRLERRMPRWVFMGFLLCMASAGPVIAVGAMASRFAGGFAVNVGLAVSPLTFAFEAAADRSWSGATASVSAFHWLMVIPQMAAGVAVWVLSSPRRLAFGVGDGDTDGSRADARPG